MASDAKTRILRWIKKQGVRPCCDPEWTGKLLECVMSVGDVFPDLVQQVSAWYCYWIFDQEGKALENEHDATYWRMVSKDGAEVIHAIGISVEALEELEGERDYSVFVCLHELAHMLTDEDHSIRFHEILSNMINQYNASTGKEISNDFFGIETRYDSRPWGLPDDIPKQQSRRGSAFRTEAKR